MDGTALIAKLALQTDDGTELSDAEALDLINDIYGDIQDNRGWEWLKKSGTLTQSTTVPYVTLPTDFRNFIPNYRRQSLNFGNAGVPAGYSNYGYNPTISGSLVSVVFVGTNLEPYQVISASQKRNYRNVSGFCYVQGDKLYFTKQPTSAETVEIDYYMIAPDITAATSPLFRAGFHPILAYGAAARNDIMMLTDKNSSYQKENQRLYDETLQSMQLEDARLKLASQ